MLRGSRHHGTYLASYHCGIPDVAFNEMVAYLGIGKVLEVLLKRFSGRISCALGKKNHHIRLHRNGGDDETLYLEPNGRKVNSQSDRLASDAHRCSPSSMGLKVIPLVKLSKQRYLISAITLGLSRSGESCQKKRRGSTGSSSSS